MKQAKALKTILKGLGLGVGVGGGAMYLGNDEEGETFTSYPRDARYKQLARGEEIPLPGLEDVMYGEGKHAQSNQAMESGLSAKDRFGFGTMQSQAPEEEVPKVDLQEWRKIPWSDATDVPLMKQAIESIAKGFKHADKPWHVPKSSWDEKRNWYLNEILGAAKDKEGFPEGMTLRELGLTNEDFVGTNPE
tara:strand:+ start:726 stop:1298 length:573 start_codon:yes stop_codon:yes gene_type:complete